MPACSVGRLEAIFSLRARCRSQEPSGNSLPISHLRTAENSLELITCLQSPSSAVVNADWLHVLHESEGNVPVREGEPLEQESARRLHATSIRAPVFETVTDELCDQLPPATRGVTILGQVTLRKALRTVEWP